MRKLRLLKEKPLAQMHTKSTEQRPTTYKARAGGLHSSGFSPSKLLCLEHWAHSLSEKDPGNVNQMNYAFHEYRGFTRLAVRLLIMSSHLPSSCSELWSQHTKVSIVPLRDVRVKILRLKTDYYLTHDYTSWDKNIMNLLTTM